VRLYRVKPIDPLDGLLGVSPRRYRGHPHVLKDGTAIKSGALIYEVHVLNNRFARQQASSSSEDITIWGATTYIARDLRTLAKEIQQGTEVEVLHGITLLCSGSRRLGFSVTDMPPGLWRGLTGFYLRGLLQVYHVQGAQRLQQGLKALVPKELWMSRKELLARYGSNPP
jgi:hypothetical protein